MPTDIGYRVYVDHLVEADDLPQRRPLTPFEAAARLDEAVALTTQALAEATGMLALVTAASTSSAVIRHIEVVQLQPTRVVVVCITATGDVARHVVTTEVPLDPGLLDWSSAYLNEQVCGMTLGQNLLRSRLTDPALLPSERAMLALLAPAFRRLVDEMHDVHVGGSAELLSQLDGDVQGVLNLVHVLDERRRLLEALQHVVSHRSNGRERLVAPRRVSVRIGAENELPELQHLSVVAASYGLTARPLGMVGVIGSRAMDYPQAMIAVNAAADALSLIAEDLHAAG